MAEDSFRYSLGVKYRPNGRWVYRCGVAYDETPIPNRQYRSVRVPGNDRTWVALGLGYRHNDSLSFDLGYAHLFVDDPEIDKGVALSPEDENFFRGNLRGEYDAEVDIVSAQITWQFY